MGDNRFMGPWMLLYGVSRGCEGVKDSGKLRSDKKRPASEYAGR